MRAARRLFPLFLTFFFPSFFLTAPHARADENLNAAARELAHKVITTLGAAAGQELELMSDSENLSSIASPDFKDGIKAFESEMQNQGVRVSSVARPGGPSVRIFLSEDAREFLWIAEIVRNGASQFVMLPVPRSSILQKPPSPPPMVLQKQLLLTQSEPILDALFYKMPRAGEQRLLVLEPDKVRAFHSEKSGWTTETDIHLRHDEPWPRDLRGRLLDVHEGLTAFFPDAECHLAFQNLWSASCAPKSSSFPVFSSHDFVQIAQFEPHRNFYGSSPLDEEVRTGMEPAYSISYVGIHVSHIYAVATQLDGRAVLYEPPSEPLGVFRGWGSEIVAQNTACGQQWQLLVTRPGDWSEPDAIQAFEISDREPVAVSTAVDFSGPVTALWAVEGGGSALAVVRNLKTRSYEAYLLSLSCSQ